MGGPDQLATAFEFNEKRGLYLGVLYGMMSTVIPKDARAVYYSRGGADMKTASPRPPSWATTSAPATRTRPTAR